MKRDVVNYDIFKIDNILIKLGYIIFIVSGITLFIMVRSNKYGDLGSIQILLTVFILPGSIAMLVYGYMVRKKENRINSILRNLEIAREISVPVMLQNTNYTEEHLQEAIEIINSRGFGYFIWNRSTNTIADGRLLRKMIFIDTCSKCGNRIGRHFPILLDQIPECTYCGSPLDVNEWNSLKIKELDKIDFEQKTSGTTGKPFSIWILILLVIFFWPGAIIYIYLRHKAYNKREMFK